jgi:hypothetical protein
MLLPPQQARACGASRLSLVVPSRRLMAPSETTAVTRKRTHGSADVRCAKRGGNINADRGSSQLLDETVGVARRVPALETGLVHPQPAEVVAAGEEPRVNGHATGLGVRVDAGHPSAHAVRVEDVVP